MNRRREGKIGYSNSKRTMPLQSVIPHMPGCEAPQRPQPASIASDLPEEEPATAKTDNCFSTFALLQ
jgi:hypothetical protein